MDNLSKYVNDHLAGATAARELLTHLIEALSGQPRMIAVLDSLRSEIELDQHVLKDLIASLGGESTVRQILGWFGEKAVRFKLLISGEQPESLGLVEALELLALGITGKQLLWRALQDAAGGRVPSRFDLAALGIRAHEQFLRVEDLRLEAARLAFKQV